MKFRWGELAPWPFEAAHISGTCSVVDRFCLRLSFHPQYILPLNIFFWQLCETFMLSLYKGQLFLKLCLIWKLSKGWDLEVIQKKNIVSYGHDSARWEVVCTLSNVTNSRFRSSLKHLLDISLSYCTNTNSFPELNHYRGTSFKEGNHGRNNR